MTLATIMALLDVGSTIANNMIQQGRTQTTDDEAQQLKAASDNMASTYSSFISDNSSNKSTK